MVWGPHIARVKTKNILNLRIGLIKAPLSYVELIVLRTDYLWGPLLVRGPARLGGSGGASFGTVRTRRIQSKKLCIISLFAKTFGHVLLRAFCDVVLVCRTAGFCFLFVSNIYEN